MCERAGRVRLDAGGARRASGFAPGFATASGTADERRRVKRRVPGAHCSLRHTPCVPHALERACSVGPLRHACYRSARCTLAPCMLCCRASASPAHPQPTPRANQLTVLAAAVAEAGEPAIGRRVRPPFRDHARAARPKLVGAPLQRRRGGQ